MIGILGCNSKGFFACFQSSRFFLASSHDVLFEKKSQKCWTFWHIIDFGPFVKTSGKSCDHYSLIETSKEPTIYLLFSLITDLLDKCHGGFNGVFPHVAGHIRLNVGP